jgi:hypothetical protein
LAARNYAALFRGEKTAGAMVAGIRLHAMVESMIAFVDAHRRVK